MVPETNGRKMSGVRPARAEVVAVARVPMPELRMLDFLFSERARRHNPHDLQSVHAAPVPARACRARVEKTAGSVMRAGILGVEVRKRLLAVLDQQGMSQDRDRIARCAVTSVVPEVMKIIAEETKAARRERDA
jgi:hypothetical protein